MKRSIVTVFRTLLFSFALFVCLAPLTSQRAMAQTTAEPTWGRGQHILIQYSGALRAPPGFSRTKEEARRRAMDVIHRATNGESFDALVKSYTDEPGGADRAGDLGLIAPGMLLPEVEQALQSLKVGEITRVPVQTAFGFHIIRRLPSNRRIQVRHILVTYTGAVRAKPGLNRTKEQARAKIEKISDQLIEGGSFEEIAKASSDDVATSAQGGMIGELRSGLTVPTFESAAFALEPGEISPIIETVFGYHVIQRVK
jgi:peptidyl-prolyl cis-trans isomerase SurA